MIEAEYYETKGTDTVCRICPKNCVIRPGRAGFCKARKNEDGKLIVLNYPHPCSISIDPVEKKPLYHFLPSEPVFSISTVGCNLACQHCQNSDIARASPGDFKEPEVEPEQIVQAALDNGCKMIAYTYTEPTIFFEYMRDVARLAKKKGLKNVSVTNGFINPEPLAEIAKYLDAANVDLKAFDDDFYKKICAARLEPVLDTIKYLHKKGVWLELTNLIIPGLNDKQQKIQELVDWVEQSVGKNVPLHISRFHPSYKLNHLPATPKETLLSAYKIAEEKLNYVYVGNILTEEGQNTVCPSCGHKVITRSGYSVEINMKEGKCQNCKQKIHGVWD